MTRPWPVVLLLTAPTWLSRDALIVSPLLVRIGASLALAGVLLVMGLRWKPRLSSGLAILATSLLAPAAAWVFGSRQPPLQWTPAPSDRPAVVLIVLDTVRADHLSVYGYQRRTTPVLEQFAQEAVLFQDAIAPSDLTLSTHASLFTGL